jgi:hypothetical protein
MLPLVLLSGAMAAGVLLAVSSLVFLLGPRAQPLAALAGCGLAGLLNGCASGAIAAFVLGDAVGPASFVLLGALLGVLEAFGAYLGFIGLNQSPTPPSRAETFRCIFWFALVSGGPLLVGYLAWLACTSR